MCKREKTRGDGLWQRMEGFSNTLRNRVWGVHTGFLGCLASEPLSYAGVSSLVDVLVRSQILTPLTPSRKVTEL